MLTRVELHLTDHQPLGVEEQLHLHVLPNTVWYGDDHLPGVLHQRISHVGEHYRLVVVVLPAHAEPQLGHAEHPHLFSVHIIGVDSHGGKVSHRVKFEDKFHGLLSQRVVPPAHPLVPADPEYPGIQAEICVALLAVRELAQAAGQVVDLVQAVIRLVAQVNTRPSPLALVHVIRHCTVCKDIRKLWATATHVPTAHKRSLRGGLMLGRRQRRRINTKATLVQRHIIVGTAYVLRNTSDNKVIKLIFRTNLKFSASAWLYVVKTHLLRRQSCLL